MKSANKFDEQESVPVPDNHVLAIIDNPEETKALVAELNRSGFSPDDIGLLAGQADAEKLDAATGRKGFFAKVLASGIDMGDRDTEYFKQYRKALMEGHAVIGVEAKSDQTRDEVRAILKSHSAQFITFFGRFVTEVLEA